MAIKGLLRINNEFNLVILKFEVLQGFFKQPTLMK